MFQFRKVGFQLCRHAIMHVTGEDIARMLMDAHDELILIRLKLERQRERHGDEFVAYGLREYGNN